MAAQGLFILNRDDVIGPFTEAELEAKLASENYDNPLIWWRGLPEWLPRGEWRRHYEELQKKSLAKAERLWKLRIAEGEPLVMSQKQLFEFLKSEADLSSIDVWTEGYKEWQAVYQIHPIMEELGISRRQHPRVPLSGTVTVQYEGKSFETEPRTISEGGMGLAQAQNLKIGQKVALVIRSSQLYLTIHTNAEVVYASKDGLVGIRFNGLSSESRSAVIEYVKKFMTQNP